MAAALSITANSVLWVSGPTGSGIAGEAITQGQLVTGAGTSADKYMKADADAATVPTGIALCAAGADGQRLVIQKSGGVIAIGATVVVAKAYYAHTTAGGIGVETDLASGDFAHFLGFAKTAANLELTFVSASAVKP